MTSLKLHASRQPRLHTGVQYRSLKNRCRMSQFQTIRSKDIYHGLPVLPDNAQGLTAVVAGANGMSGDHMVSWLSNTRSL